MAIVTDRAHVASAIRLLGEKEHTYVALGKGKTAWNDDKNPPAEVSSTTDISEVIGMKKCSTVSLCRRLGVNEETAREVITYKGAKWVVVPENLAYAENAHFLYLRATIEGTEIPLGYYRQIGVYTGTSLKHGVTSTGVAPGDINAKGTLQFYENRQPQNRTASVTTIESFMIEL